MRLLLDTQAFLWAVSDPYGLRGRARRQIESPSNDVFVSAATGWEIAIKSKLGRLTLPDDPQRFVPDQMDESSFAPLPVLMSHALKVLDLPEHYRDPFDRLLIAQATSKTWCS